jgi:hypothetical protein
MTMINQLIRAVFAGVKEGKRDVQLSKKDTLSHWRYVDLLTNPLLHPPEYLFNLAKDAAKRKHVHDLDVIADYLRRHTAFEGTFGKVLAYIQRSIKRIQKAS